MNFDRYFYLYFRIRHHWQAQDLLSLVIPVVHRLVHQKAVRIETLPRLYNELVQKVYFELYTQGMFFDAVYPEKSINSIVYTRYTRYIGIPLVNINQYLKKTYNTLIAGSVTFPYDHRLSKVSRSSRFDERNIRTKAQTINVISCFDIV